jgi:hypothetical protein
MVRSGEPHGKLFYAGVALFALPAGTVFAFRIFAPGSMPFGWRLATAGVAMVFIFGALQAFERLLRPEIAHRRSSALSTSTRRKLRAARKAIVGMVFPGYCIAAIMLLTGGEHAQDVVSDLVILAGVLVFLACCLADLSGERSLFTTE